MSAVSPLYNQRFHLHLNNANICYNNGDYIQAGEKIWGALSALINSRSPREIRNVNRKKRYFLNLLRLYIAANPLFSGQMRQFGFRRNEDLWHAIYGLHEFFYGGGRSHSNHYLSGIIPFLIQLLNNL